MHSVWQTVHRKRLLKSCIRKHSLYKKLMYSCDLCTRTFYHEDKLHSTRPFCTKADNDCNTKHLIDHEGNTSTADFLEVYLHSLQEPFWKKLWFATSHENTFSVKRMSL